MLADVLNSKLLGVWTHGEVLIKCSGSNRGCKKHSTNRKKDETKRWSEKMAFQSAAKIELFLGDSCTMQHYFMSYAHDQWCSTTTYDCKPSKLRVTCHFFAHRSEMQLNYIHLYLLVMLFKISPWIILFIASVISRSIEELRHIVFAMFSHS